MVAPWEDPSVVGEDPKKSSAPWDVGDVDSGESLLGTVKHNLIDAAKTAPGAIAKGVAGIYGLPGTIAEGLRSAGVNIQNPPDVVDLAGTVHPGTIPTPESIQKGIESYTGEFHKPETTLGEYTQSAGEMVPAALTGPGGLLRRLFTQAVVPGAASEAATELTDTKGKREEPWVRAAASIISPAALERLITPVRSVPGRAAAIQNLRNEDVTDLSAGQVTGSRPLRFSESTLGMGSADRLVERQNRQFTQAALRRIGENEELATPEVLDRAFTRIGNVFDHVAANNTLQVDRRVYQDLSDARNGYNRLVPPNMRSPVVQDMIDDFVHNSVMHLGRVPGDVWGSFRSQLATAARESAGNPQLQRALHEMVGAVDANMERVLSRTNLDDLAAIRQARRQYRNILVVERAANYAGEAAASGVITPANLGRATRTLQGMRNYARGQGDFADLARSGNIVMNPMPSSGTSERWWSHAVPSALAAAALAPASIPAAIAGVAAPRILGSAMLSRPGRAYFGNRLLEHDPNPYRNALIRGTVAGSNPYSGQ